MISFIRRNSSSVRKFLQSTNKDRSRPKLIQQDPICSDKPTNKSEFTTYKVQNATHKDFINTKVVPSFADSSSLPHFPEDIKGVDENAYSLLYKNKVQKPMPVLMSNEFFSLIFFPSDHFVSSYRKSNISYTFTNYGPSKLNSQVLEKAINSYKGKYRSTTFFQENLQPFTTAVGRSNNRKLMKRCLFNALCDQVKTQDQLVSVSGIFRFRFLSVPVTDKDKSKVQRDISNSVNRILEDRMYRSLLSSGTKKSNQAREVPGGLKPNASQTSSSWKVPENFPKTPFYNKSTTQGSKRRTRRS